MSSKDSFRCASLAKQCSENYSSEVMILPTMSISTPKDLSSEDNGKFAD